MRSAFHPDVPFEFAWWPGAHRNRPLVSIVIPPGFGVGKLKPKRSALIVGFWVTRTLIQSIYQLYIHDYMILYDFLIRYLNVVVIVEC